MGFLERMSVVVQAKMNKIMNRIEDPREVLEVSYEKQLQLLQNVKRGVAEVTTSKKRLELQKAKLQMNIDQLDGQAKEAISASREDLARKALESKALMQAQLNTLERETKELNDQQLKLQAADPMPAAAVAPPLLDPQSLPQAAQPMHGALPVLMPCFFMPLSFVCMVAVLL